MRHVLDLVRAVQLNLWEAFPYFLTANVILLLLCCMTCVSPLLVRLTDDQPAAGQSSCPWDEPTGLMSTNLGMRVVTLYNPAPCEIA